MHFSSLQWIPGWLLWLGVVGIVGGLYWIGNRLLGRPQGGKRLVLFVGGPACATLGALLCREFWPRFKDGTMPGVFLFVLGAVALGLGAYLFGASIFASGKTLDEAFDSFISGF